MVICVLCILFAGCVKGHGGNQLGATGVTGKWKLNPMIDGFCDLWLLLA